MITISSKSVSNVSDVFSDFPDYSSLVDLESEYIKRQLKISNLPYEMCPL